MSKGLRVSVEMHNRGLDLVIWTVTDVTASVQGSSFGEGQKVWRAGTTPILKKTLREFGLKFWRPTHSESRSESCSENRVFT